MCAEHATQEIEAVAPRLSFPSPQGCHHNVGTFTNEWFDLALQYLGLERSQCNILFHGDWLIQVLTHVGLECMAPCSVGPSPATPRSSTTVPCWLNKRDALTIAQGVESLSISLSLIMLMILPSVQVPIMIGTH